VRKATGNHLTHLIPGGVKANEPAFGQRTFIIEGGKETYLHVCMERGVQKMCKVLQREG